jgi:hypothetical protein
MSAVGQGGQKVTEEVPPMLIAMRHLSVPGAGRSMMESYVQVQGVPLPPAATSAGDPGVLRDHAQVPELPVRVTGDRLAVATQQKRSSHVSPLTYQYKRLQCP